MNWYSANFTSPQVDAPKVWSLLWCPVLTPAMDVYWASEIPVYKSGMVQQGGVNSSTPMMLVAPHKSKPTRMHGPKIVPAHRTILPITVAGRGVLPLLL